MVEPVLNVVAGKVYAGTSGWSYQDWIGPFYEKGTASAEFLRSYSTRFPAVEVDSTFYAVPRGENVESWMKRTPDGFRFAFKVPGLVTHGAQGERPEPDKVLRDLETLDRFIDVLEPVVPKISCLLFQFPYFRVATLERNDFNDRLARALDRVPIPLRAAVEIRNKTWITDDYLAALRDREVASVMIDHPYMPSPRSQLELGMVTTDFAYVRLLGDRYAIEKKTQRWSEVVEDKSRRLRTWADVIHDILRRYNVNEIYVFANNHFAGHAPETVRELLAQVDQEAVSRESSALLDSSQPDVDTSDDASPTAC